LNIIIFYQYFGTSKGGWSTRMYEMPKKWIEAGHSVSIVTSPYDKSDISATGFIDKQMIEGIEVIIVNLKQSNKHSLVYRALTFILFSIISIYFALTRKYDVILCSSGPITVGMPGILAKLFRPKKKFVFEVRDLWPDGAIQLGLIKNRWVIKLSYLFEKVCYKKSDLIVTCSKGMTDSIAHRFGGGNILTIPNACDNIFFQTETIGYSLPDWAQDKKIFIYTGSLGLMDDCMQILKGIELVDIPDAIFVFIGEGKERAAMENYVKGKSISGAYFIGLIPKTEVRSWLQHAYAAFVTFKNVPILQTSSPNKMFDAFASGVPIIQSTTGWIRDLMDKEKFGLSVNPDNPEEMAEAIRQMANNPEKRDAMAKTAKRLAASDFNRDVLADDYLGNMLRICNK
jgi:glycosyltransferase involved in cell wall biosynthesis